MFGFLPATENWLKERHGEPAAPQRAGWPAIRSGGHVLISAPTGSGKTLAAFLAALDDLFRQAIRDELPDETQVVYVSPLKALSNDIQNNLEEPLAGIASGLISGGESVLPVRASVRTGDTPAKVRQQMARKPPHILVTTPESLYLLLTSESGRKGLRNVRTLIVDEIHSLVGNRRGSHLSLSVERLAHLTRQRLQRIGLSATQKPIEEVARFLEGSRHMNTEGKPQCAILEIDPHRAMDLGVELPRAPLSAVMSNEVWEEVYERLCDLIQRHRTTLVFVNTRRLAERLAHHLAARIGGDKIASHHGSLSAELRLSAEQRLKRGELRALVATSSLELGIDIGSVDLVCQLGSTRSIATLIQRVGRAEHRHGGLPKGRLFPLSRDELSESAALLASVRQGNLDQLVIPEQPMDILAQQIVACAAAEEWTEKDLFSMITAAYPYRNLTDTQFHEIVQMLANGFAGRKGRRSALIHYDAINGRVRSRKGSRLVAVTCGGAIPETGDFRVVCEPGETTVGTVNEDFALESMAGDIFQLGNSSWQIQRVHSGVVRVADAHGQPPSIPFWLGEAPARTRELSKQVSDLRAKVEQQLHQPERLMNWLRDEVGLADVAANQWVEYFKSGHRVLGVIPTQQRLVLERFFDESGGMQLVLHSPYNSALNRAWGLALRKRFCRKFNFELQAAATEDAIILSLGIQHSFPLEEVFHYLHSHTVRDLLVQALLDAPMFAIRWRWNASRALAVRRQQGDRRTPPQIQRMEAENLLAAVFPDQLACLENIGGDREIPDHPLVRQTIEDCLNEAMDLPGLVEVLQNIESGKIECIARDLPEPSPFSLEILNARPYAFLDDAPLEERRTRAVYARRYSDPSSADELGQLDQNAIEKVCHEAWPEVSQPDELHEALLLMGIMRDADLARSAASTNENGATLFQELIKEGRAGRFWPDSNENNPGFLVAAERFCLVQAAFPAGKPQYGFAPPHNLLEEGWTKESAIRELVRGRLEVSGPITASQLSDILLVPEPAVQQALLELESEGFVLRGSFRAGVRTLEWSERRLLARIHRLTIHRLRAEIQPVSPQEFLRFLLRWQCVDPEYRLDGPEGLVSVLECLDGCELPVAAWEPEVLSARIQNYDPQWLDRLCLTGRVGWGRLHPPRITGIRGPVTSPIRTSPVALFLRDNFAAWNLLSEKVCVSSLSHNARRVLELLQTGGALFFSEVCRRSGLLPTQVEEAFGELVTLGIVTADGFDGLRALMLPSDRRPALGRADTGRRKRGASSVEFAGRWSLLRSPVSVSEDGAQPLMTTKARTFHRMQGGPENTCERLAAIETGARVLLRRYGILFKRLLEREALDVSWYELGKALRRLEAKGEIRGGHFVSGVSGEQFALPEAIGTLRNIRKEPFTNTKVVLSGADPLNLVGILTPHSRVSSLTHNRILFLDGLPIAASVRGGAIEKLERAPEVSGREIEQALTIGTLPPALRTYYRYG